MRPLQKRALIACIGVVGLTGTIDKVNAAEPPLATDTFVLPGVPKVSGDQVLHEDGARVLVRDVQFHGNTVFSHSALRTIALPYIDRTLGALELEEILRSITARYVERGYVNSGAHLEAGALSGDGTLHVTVVEGRLSKVRLRGLDGLSEHYVTDRLVPDASAPLNIENVRERYQLLLSDPLFAGIATRLIPDVSQGKAILDVDVTRARPYLLSLSANNYRAPSIGENSLDISGLVRNLTGHGDTFSANWQGAPQGNTSGRLGINWMLPLNGWGTLLTVQSDKGASSVIEEPLTTLGIRSTLTNFEVGLNQTVLDTLRSRLNYGISKSLRTNRTWLLDEPFSFGVGIPDGVLTQSTWKAWQDFTYRTDSSVFVARITRSQVQNNLTMPLIASEADQLPPNQYGYWVTQLNIAHRFADGGAQFQARATLQNASTHLTSLDGLAIGGATTVRGYRENQLLRDQGALVTVEVQIPMKNQRSAGEIQWSLTPFFDYGKGNNVGEASATLSSTGVALAAEWRKFTLNFALAHRLIHPSSVDALSGTLQDRSMHFLLTYQVF